MGRTIEDRTHIPPFLFYSLLITTQLHTLHCIPYYYYTYTHYIENKALYLKPLLIIVIRRGAFLFQNKCGMGHAILNAKPLAISGPLS